ncbi:MAG: twin-arginine translocase subunit TatC [Planctomycetota bacterium]
MEGKKLSIGEHLEELRLRLIYSAIIFVITTIVCLIFQEQIIKIIVAPHLKIASGKTLKIFNYPEGFFVYFKASLIAGLLLAAPFIIYQIWKFISAGLYPHEKKYVIFYLPSSLTLFIIGVLFSYFIFIPFMLDFLYHYSDPAFVESTINLNNYFNLFIMFTLIMGGVFELPLIMLFLVQIKLFTPKIYLGKWKIVILLAFIIAAIITPSGDPLTQTLFAIPLLLLYIMGILLSYLFLKLGKPKNTE